MRDKAGSTFTAKPMDADAVLEVSHALWMAMVFMPKHRHRTGIVKTECSTCKAHEYIVKAYRMLPVADFKEA